MTVYGTYTFDVNTIRKWFTRVDGSPRGKTVTDFSERLLSGKSVASGNQYNAR